MRDGVVVDGDLSIETLRREKDDVTEVREGYECGINLGSKDIAEGDVIETWRCARSRATEHCRTSNGGRPPFVGAAAVVVS